MLNKVKYHTTLKKLFLLPIFFLCMLMLSCNLLNPKKDTNPDEVVTAFINAMEKKDFGTAEDLATAASKGSFTMLKIAKFTGNGEAMEFDKTKMNVSKAIVTGDSANVKITFKDSDGGFNLPMKIEDGSWRIAFDPMSLLGTTSGRLNDIISGVTDSLGGTSGILNNLDSMKKEMDKAMEDADLDSAKFKEEMEKAIKSTKDVKDLMEKFK